MPSYSSFLREKSISVDDHALRKENAPLAKRNGFAARVRDFYEDPKKARRQWRKGLTVDVKVHPDGLAKLTFAVFDGCVIRHYLDETRKRELGAVLALIGKHAKSARPGATGIANFCVEAGGDDFWFLLDYDKKAVFLEYDERVTIDFRDEETKAKSPANAMQAWERVFALQKTAAGKAQLASEREEAKRAALAGIRLHLGPSQELVSIEPIAGETTKVRFYHGLLTNPASVDCVVVDRESAERRADRRTKKRWHAWPRIEHPTELLRIVELLSSARANCKPKNKVVGEAWLGWGSWY